MVRRYYSNLAPAVMTTGSLSAGATSVAVTSLVGFPGSFPYVVALERGTASEELILVTAAVGSSATIVRGYGGTTGKTHATGVTFEHVVDATDADEANSHVNATTGVHGVAGALVGSTDTQTLTNKTLSGSKVQATTTDPGLLSLAAASGTQPHLIGKDSTNTTTEWQVAKGGNASFKDTTVQALTATGVTSSGAISGPSAAISGAVTAGSVVASGAVTAGSLSTGGSLSVTGNVSVVGTVQSANWGGRVARTTTDTNTTTSSGNTEIVSTTQPSVTLVTGRRYKFTLNAVLGGSAAPLAIRANLHISTNTVTAASGTVCTAIGAVGASGGPGTFTIETSDEFVAASSAVHYLALGVVVRPSGGSGNATGSNWYVLVEDLGV